jgi:hypothetical protein
VSAGGSGAEHERFVELLAAHVRGALQGEEAAWMQAYLQRHPAAQAQVRFDTMIARQLAEDARNVPADVGLERLLQKVRSEPARTLLPGLSAARLGDFFRVPQVAWAMAALVVLQFGLISAMWMRGHEAGNTPYRSTGGAPVPVLKVQFLESATEREIRNLLIAAGGFIVGGPNQLGEYELLPDAGTPQELLARLRESPLVDSASVAQGGSQ